MFLRHPDSSISTDPRHRSQQSLRHSAHRNTLVYRLDKLQKSTGLDLRVFEDAITFKIALMVVKYMNYMETFDY